MNRFHDEYAGWNLNDLYFEKDALSRRYEMIMDYRDTLDTLDRYIDHVLALFSAKAQLPRWVQHLHSTSLSLVNVIPDVTEALEELDDRIAAVEQLLPIERQLTLDEATE